MDNARSTLETFDPVVVVRILQRLAQIPGWAVLKGWAELPELSGDLDTVAEPAALPRLSEELASWTRLGWTRAVLACPHLPAVPRFFLWIDGSQKQFLELDFVLQLTFRGVPLVSYDRVLPHLVLDQRHGYPRTSKACLSAIDAIFKQLRWDRRDGLARRVDDAVVRDLAGPLLGRLLGRALRAPRARPWALLASVVAVLRAMAHPTAVRRRAFFWCRRPVCSLDPRLGRGVRRLGPDPEARLRQLLEESGHRLLSLPAGGRGPCA
jgi:hypothetical protein